MRRTANRIIITIIKKAELTYMNKGKLIVIEGACDGIGKSTQFKMLSDRMAANGNLPVCHHFPSYGTPQGAPVESYLRGEYGAPETLSPYFVNMLYALDRAVTVKTLLAPSLEEGRDVLLDRYTTSSLIYQSSFITDKTEKQKFIEYVTDFEYSRLGIPKPGTVLFLNAPYECAESLRKSRTSNDGVEHDIHESSGGFMKKVYDSAQLVCDMCAFTRIDCTDADGRMYSRETIHEKIMSALKDAGIKI